MTWTNCGSKEVIKMFDRDRKEIEKERFLQDDNNLRRKRNNMCNNSTNNTLNSYMVNE